MISAAPAGYPDLVELLEASGRLTLGRRSYGWLIAQIAFSEAVVVRDMRRSILCIGGIAPLPGSSGEIWFGVKSGGLDQYLLPVVRLTRHYLAARGEAYQGGLFTSVIEGHLAGERLAKMIGCSVTEEKFGLHRRWECRLWEKPSREAPALPAEQPQSMRA